MRLINVKTRKLEEFDTTVPPYAILSHTWGPDIDEISFHDVRTQSYLGQDSIFARLGIGYRKFDGCCNRAQEEGLEYAWIDTCCIDQTNAAEVQEAINSMFSWYQRAVVCYAVLSDVSSSRDVNRTFELEFRASRWFERGWTLQELLAPRELVFYTAWWNRLGTKRQLASVIADITGIPRPYLLGVAKLESASIAQRMSWAAGRATRRKEDIAYSLLGIFNVRLYIRYGEGTKAFIRLQEEILRKTSDHSILAWDIGLTSQGNNERHSGTHVTGSALAYEPAQFANSGTIIPDPRHIAAIDVNPGPRLFCEPYLQVQTSLYTTGDGQTYCRLNCRSETDEKAVVGIPLRRIAYAEDSAEFMRPAGSKAILLAEGGPATAPQSVRIHETVDHDQTSNYKRRYGFWIEIPSDRRLEMIDVYPKDRWERKTSLILTGTDSISHDVQRTWVRLRDTLDSTQDFIVALELERKGLKHQAQCFVMTASRDTTLEAIDSMQQSPDAMRHLLRKATAKTPSFVLRAELTEERCAREVVYVVSLTEMVSFSDVTVDADAELELQRDGLLLQKTFEHDQKVRHQVDGLLKAAQERNIEIAKLRKRIENLERELQEKAREKTMLSVKLGAETEKLGRITRDKEQLEEADETIGEMISKYQGLSGAQRASAWLDSILDHLLEAFRNNWPSARSMQNKTQRAFMVAIASGNVPAVRFVYEHLGNIDFEDGSGHGVLWTAVRCGKLSTLCWLLENTKRNVDRVDGFGATPLQQAARQGSTAAVCLFLDHKASINLKDKKGLSPLHHAASTGCPETIALLLDRGANIEAVSEQQHTPLAIAARDDRLEGVVLLLDRGAKIAGTDSFGAAPLFLAASMGNVAVVSELLGRGADTETKGSTPLHAAVTFGHLSVAGLLLDNEADMEAKNMLGYTPLLVAASIGRSELISLLLDHGADTGPTTTWKSMTALHLAAACGHLMDVQALIHGGANMEAEAGDSTRPLMRAALHGHRDIVEMLLRSGADVDARDKFGSTAFTYAAHGPCESSTIGPVLDVFLDYGVDINMQNSQGCTTLHAAVDKGSAELVRLLLERGADRSVKHPEFGTPLEHVRNRLGGAGEGGRMVMEEMIQLLETMVPGKLAIRSKNP